MSEHLGGSTPTIRDATTLRRIVTKDRLRVYEFLVRHGVSRVGEVAEGLSIAVGSASLHLKVLHEEGFIEPAPDVAADKRSSYWRAVPGGVRFDLASGDDREYVGAVAQAQALLVDRRTELTSRWHDVQASWSADWRDASAEVDTILCLDATQLAEMSRELAAVVDKWKLAAPGEISHEVFVAWSCFPVCEVADPSRDRERHLHRPEHTAGADPHSPNQ